MRSLGLQNLWGDPGDPRVSPSISYSSCRRFWVPVAPGPAHCGRLLWAPHGWVTMGTMGTMGVLQSGGKAPEKGGGAHSPDSGGAEPPVTLAQGLGCLGRC